MPPLNKWLTIKNEADSPAAEIMIYGDIGDDIFDKSGTYATQFGEALKSIPDGKQITARFHSRGGAIWDAFPIANMIQNRGNITGIIDGVALSAAAIIFNACAKRIMPKLGMQMIHETRAPANTTANGHEDLAETLRAHDAVLAEFLAKRSGKSTKDVAAMMAAETWMNGDQAKDAGFCDEVIETEPIENSFDLSNFRRVPGNVVNKTTAPQPPVGAQPKANLMKREEMIALLKNWGVTVPENSTDEQIVNMLKAGKPVTAPAATPPAPDNSRMEAIEKQLAAERKTRIENIVNTLVENRQVTAAEVTNAVARAIKDESYLTELQARPQVLPGNEPLNAGLTIVNEDARNIVKGIMAHVPKEGQGCYVSSEIAAARAVAVSNIYTKERERLISVMNAAATNTVDSALKRTLILQETVRDFATRVLPLRLFSTVFSNVPLQGTDTITVAYYPLQTVASSDFTDGDGTGGTGYTFGQASTTNKAQVTVNKRKYQPLDYSSREFRFQPWFDAVRLGAINAEKLGVDILTDILSVVTAANFGAAAKTSSAVAMTSDDVVDMRGVANAASWPDGGRSLIVDSTVDTALQKDPSYKLALNIGTAAVIQQGKFPNLSGFDYAWMPNLPTNSEKLIGFAAFASAILSAFAPVDPAPGVRAQLVAYQVATDAATGISLNYRHWGLAQADRDFEVIESCYGYVKGVTGAIKRIVAP